MTKLFKLAVALALGGVILVGRVYSRDFPQPLGYVNDFAQVLSQDTKAKLEQDLTDFEATTSYELAVVTLDSLEGDTVENVAVDLFETWGIGKKQKDNGVLLLIAVSDRKLRIEVGYGTEPVLTDSRAGNIIRNEITPQFKAGDYDAGVSAGVAAIIKVLSQDPTAFDQPSNPPTSSSAPFEFLPLVLIFLFIYASAFLGRSKRFWPGGVLGFILGIIFFSIIGGIFIGLLGLFLDFVLSKNYRTRKKQGLTTSWWSSKGGFSSGGSSGGFGGFGGGSSGGGGASGSW